MKLKQYLFVTDVDGFTAGDFSGGLDMFTDPQCPKDWVNCGQVVIDLDDDTLQLNSIALAGSEHSEPTRPAHYTESAIEPLAFIQANQMGFAEGNIIKYVSRYKSKGGLDDLRKAQSYLELLIESEQVNHD